MSELLLVNARSTNGSLLTDTHTRYRSAPLTGFQFKSTGLVTCALPTGEVRTGAALPAHVGDLETMNCLWGETIDGHCAKSASTYQSTLPLGRFTFSVALPLRVKIVEGPPSIDTQMR